MPMSYAPEMALCIPTVESLCWISISALVLIARYASTSFSISGVTEEEPPTTSFPAGLLPE